MGVILGKNTNTENKVRSIKKELISEEMHSNKKENEDLFKSIENKDNGIPFSTEEIEDEEEEIDFDTKVLNNVSTMLEDFLSKCNLSKPVNEWATLSVNKQAKEILFLTIKYQKTLLTKDLRVAVSMKFLQYDIITVCQGFLKFTVTDFPEIFQKDENLYLTEIDEVLARKKELISPKSKETKGNSLSNGTEKQHLIESSPALFNINKESTIEPVNEPEQVVVLTVEEQHELDLKVDSLTASLKELRMLKNMQSVIGSLLATIINCTNVNKEFCECCTAKNGLLSTLLGFFEIYTPILNETDKKDYLYSKLKTNSRLRIFNYVLGSILNISKITELVHLLKESNTVQFALPFLKCPLRLFAMKVLLCLSNLIEESNNHLIMADTEPIKLLLTYIKGATKDEKHRYFGFDLKELIEGLASIAQNDSNNKIIGENKGITVMSFAFLTSSYIEDCTEKRSLLSACCHTIWKLSFNESNREILCKDEILIENLKQLKEKNEMAEVQSAASGSYWEIVGKNIRTCNPGVIQEESQTENERHVMISYHWDYQDVLLKVRDKLQETGYKVWMDVDQMGGSTLEAMAKAVENASIILMTVCNQYKNSANCRSEAEYAFQLKRTIIPLMMQSDYKADGWLGFIVGAKYWINFTNLNQLDSSFEKLLKELSQISNDGRVTTVNKIEANATTGQVVAAVSAQGDSPSTSSAVVHQLDEWSTDDVNAWLIEIELDKLCEKYQNKIDGKLLVKLLAIKNEAPEAFYQICRHDLGYDFIDTIKFTDALELVKSPNYHMNLKT